ncbi:MAG: hypothetical protein AB2A00_02570 [Myxococcota bacterium]
MSPRATLGLAAALVLLLTSSPALAQEPTTEAPPATTEQPPTTTEEPAPEVESLEDNARRVAQGTAAGAGATGACLLVAGAVDAVVSVATGLVMGLMCLCLINGLANSCGSGPLPSETVAQIVLLVSSTTTVGMFLGALLQLGPLFPVVDLVAFAVALGVESGSWWKALLGAAVGLFPTVLGALVMVAAVTAIASSQFLGQLWYAAVTVNGWPLETLYVGLAVGVGSALLLYATGLVLSLVGAWAVRPVLTTLLTTRLPHAPWADSPSTPPGAHAPDPVVPPDARGAER